MLLVKTALYQRKSLDNTDTQPGSWLWEQKLLTRVKRDFRVAVRTHQTFFESEHEFSKSIREHFLRTISQGYSILSARDILFACLSLLFSLAACKGILLLSPLGAGIDSDLQNYAQILEVARYPAAFAADPVAPIFVHDPDVPNLLTVLTGFFSSSANAAVAILKAGCIALWLHLISWYALGRFLWSRASLAALLSLVCSITF